MMSTTKSLPNCITNYKRFRITKVENIRESSARVEDYGDLSNDRSENGESRNPPPFVDANAAYTTERKNIASLNLSRSTKFGRFFAIA